MYCLTASHASLYAYVPGSMLHEATLKMDCWMGCLVCPATFGFYQLVDWIQGPPGGARKEVGCSQGRGRCLGHSDSAQGQQGMAVSNDMLRCHTGNKHQTCSFFGGEGSIRQRPTYTQDSVMFCIQKKVQYVCICSIKCVDLQMQLCVCVHIVWQFAYLHIRRVRSW